MKKQTFNFDEIRKEIFDTSLETSIYIGCDSIVKKDVTYVTAVVIHYDSKHGGRIFYDVSKDVGRKITMRERLLKEVYKSVETGLALVDVIGDRNFVIHIDVASDKRWGSHIVYKEAMSYVRSFSMNVVAKHESWAAFCCADFLCKHIA